MNEWNLACLLNGCKYSGSRLFDHVFDIHPHVMALRARKKIQNEPKTIASISATQLGRLLRGRHSGSN